MLVTKQDELYEKLEKCLENAINRKQYKKCHKIMSVMQKLNMVNTEH